MRETRQHLDLKDRTQAAKITSIELDGSLRIEKYLKRTITQAVTIILTCKTIPKCSAKEDLCGRRRTGWVSLLKESITVNWTILTIAK